MTLLDAAVERLQSVLPSSVAVYDSQVPGIPQADSDGVGRYIVLHATDGMWSASGASGVSNDITETIQVMSVVWFANATSSPGVESRWLAGAVKAALVDWAPPIEGYGPVVHTLQRATQSDEKIRDRPALVAVDQFSVLADRIS